MTKGDDPFFWVTVGAAALIGCLIGALLGAAAATPFLALADAWVLNVGGSIGAIVGALAGAELWWRYGW